MIHDAENHLNPPLVTAAGAKILEVRELNAGYYGKPVVQNASLYLCSGEFVGLVGHNGSGKSTVLLGIAGLTWAKAESIELQNVLIGIVPACARARHGLGTLLQSDGVFPDLSVKVNMALAGLNPDGPEIFDQASELGIKFRDIASRRHQRAGSLSGGERRLLSLALILARRPTIILADEPTLGLSESLELAVMGFLRDFASREGQAVLVVSHNIRLVESLCSRSYVIERGVMRSEWRPGRQGQTLVQQVKGSL